MDYRCYKVASDINLPALRHYLGLAAPRWLEDRVVMQGRALADFSRMDPGSRQIHIFRYGILVFVHYELDLILPTLNQLLRILQCRGTPISDSAVSGPGAGSQGMAGWLEYFEGVDLAQLEIPEPEVEQAAAALVPAFMARSVEFHWLETRLDQLLEHETLLVDLNRRKWSQRSLNKTLMLRRQIILFQYAAMHRVRLTDLPGIGLNQVQSQAARLIAAYFAMGTRRQVFEQKMNQIDRMNQRQSVRRTGSTMLGMYWLEIVLLIIFPLLSWVPAGPLLQGAFDWLRQWLPWL